MGGSLWNYIWMFKSLDIFKQYWAFARCSFFKKNEFSLGWYKAYNEDIIKELTLPSHKIMSCAQERN